MHEHHVGVAAVAQLVATEAAHRHDRHPGRRRRTPLGGDRLGGHRQRGLQRGLGQVGQRVADRDHLQQPAQVGHRDPEQLASPDRADREDRRLRVLLPASRREHLLDQRLPTERD